MRDDDQRVSVAQTFIGLSCAGSLILLAVMLAAPLFGRTEPLAALVRQPVQTLRALGFLAAYLASAYLIGRRRRSGAILGLALYGYSILRLGLAGHLIDWHMGWALVGVVVIMRAWPALGSTHSTPAP